MTNETEDQAKVLISIEGGIAWPESDQAVLIFTYDQDVIFDYSVDDLNDKLEELDDFEGESWEPAIRKRIQRAIDRKRREEEEQERAQDELRQRHIEDAKQTLIDAGYELP